MSDFIIFVNPDVRKVDRKKTINESRPVWRSIDQRVDGNVPKPSPSLNAHNSR